MGIDKKGARHPGCLGAADKGKSEPGPGGAVSGVFFEGKEGVISSDKQVD